MALEVAGLVVLVVLVVLAALVVVGHWCGKSKVAPWRGQSCSSCQPGSLRSRCTLSLKVLVALEVVEWAVLVEEMGQSISRRCLHPMQADWCSTSVQHSLLL